MAGVFQLITCTLHWNSRRSCYNKKMPRKRPLNVEINLDQVLRAQGGDPEILKARKPQLVDTARRAVQLAIPLLDPQFVFEEYLVTGVSHSRVLLNGPSDLVGEGVAGVLAQSQDITAVVATIGGGIERISSEYYEKDPVLSLALDACGTVAVEQLVVEICRKMEEDHLMGGRYTSIPYSPGLDGWDVASGQKQIFALVDAVSIGVRLTDEFMMLPQKTSSFVIGLSRKPFEKSSTCDYCQMRSTCRYREHR